MFYPVAGGPDRPVHREHGALPESRQHADLLVRATIQPPGGTAAGAGATAEATVGANGAVTGLTITNPGHDYTAATVAHHRCRDRGDRERGRSDLRRRDRRRR